MMNPGRHFGGGLIAAMALAMSGDNQMRVRVGPIKPQKPAKPKSNRQALLLEKALRRQARAAR